MCLRMALLRMLYMSNMIYIFKVKNCPGNILYLYIWKTGRTSEKCSSTTYIWVDKISRLLPKFRLSKLRSVNIADTVRVIVKMYHITFAEVNIRQRMVQLSSMLYSMTLPFLFLLCICCKNCASSGSPDRFASTRTTLTVELLLTIMETKSGAEKRNANPTNWNKVQLLVLKCITSYISYLFYLLYLNTFNVATHFIINRRWAS